MTAKHYTIPVFIPELACPFQCVFCNQKKITGHINIPDEKEIIQTIESYLKSFTKINRFVEVGFFGGSFTGIPIEDQKKYLKLIHPYIKSGDIKGLRLSTRPDYINHEILSLLAEYKVTTIELGAQSFDDKVLSNAQRGHNTTQIIEASNLIKEYGFKLGLQIMTGLPGDTLETTIFSAQRVIDLGATDTRIYPVVVIKDTALHNWFNKGKFTPLTTEEAVYRVKHIIPMFEDSGVNIIRVGLHPSEGLLSGEELVAGPFHPGFRELVYTELWNDILNKIPSANDMCIEISIPEKEVNYAIGYKSKNKMMLEEKFKQVKFIPEKELCGRNYQIALMR